MFRRNKVAMLVAEFLGTGILTLVVLSVQRSQLGLAYFVALAAGLAVVMATYVLGPTSGAHLNPALTIGLWTARRVRTLPAIAFIVAQLLGAWAAYALYHFFVHTDVQAVTQSFNSRILVAEAIGTLIFTFGWAAAAYNRFEDGRFAATAGVSFALALIVASAASVGLANPALAEGVRAWEVFGSNGWLNYVVGPIIGAVLGVNLYGLLFADADRGLFGRRRGASAGVVTISTAEAIEESNEDDDDLSDDNDEAAVEDDGAENDAPAKTVSATPKGATAVSKSKKTSSKKVSKRKR